MFLSDVSAWLFTLELAPRDNGPQRMAIQTNIKR
jgi:hypothetical protein